ncbi:MAG TPA: tetratricopeptide repeat protein, partial [Myxococcaceae bacterium]|nr:tetratricopeptide repeat protein [Myxococcaceae bacterium]
WSRTFNGDLTDVFDLQERVARAITDELEIVLQGDQRNRLVPVATSNAEAYALYLQATAIFIRRDGERFPDGIAHLEQALRLDPGYARAWSRLATLWVLTPTYWTGDLESSLASAEKAAHRAVELDPSLAEPHAVLGAVFGFRRRFLEARAAFREALKLDPDDVSANYLFGASLVVDGYTRQGKQLLDKVLTLDPMHPSALGWRGRVAFVERDLDLAERLARRARDAGLAIAPFWLSSVTNARGQPHQAAAQLTDGLVPQSRDLPAGMVEALARGAFGDAQSRDQALAVIERYLATRPKILSGAVPYALLLLGQPAEALELLAEGPTRNDNWAFPALWGPEGREARGLPVFAEFCRRVGLADLWEQEGAPDLCRRAEARTYVCE